MSFVTYIEAHEAEIRRAIEVLRQRIAMNPESFTKALGSRKYLEAIEVLLKFAEEMLKRKEKLKEYISTVQPEGKTQRPKVEQKRVWYSFKLIHSYSQLRLAHELGLDLRPYVERFSKTCDQIEKRFKVDMTNVRNVASVLLARRKLNGKDVAALNDTIVSFVHQFLNEEL